jgi:hypothetical protein
MKKTNRSKLSLDRETVQNLSAPQLQAAGGAVETGYSVCYGTCASACHSCMSQCLCNTRFGCITTP